MWKVKRMNTARIVVLTMAVGAGGIAACPAAGCGNMLLPAASAGELASADAPALNGTTALGRKTDVTERTPL